MYRFLVAFSLVTFMSHAQPTNVLFIGNSYTHMNNLCKIYQNLANSKGKMVFGDTIAVSGSTLKGHTERDNTYKKIKSKNWDYVFIQGYSRELSYDSVRISKETVPYAKILIDSIKKYNPCVNIYYYMTWGYADGFKDSIPEDNYTLMQERIQKGYVQLSKETGGYPIAPVGMVWQEVRKKYPDINLYAPDRAHPSPFGSFTAACTFYSAIYKESPFGGLPPKKVDTLSAQKIEKTAFDIVSKNFTKYHLDTLQIPKSETEPKLDFAMQEKWLSVSITNRTIGGAEYFWDFGDGMSSTQRSPKHYYKKSGKYTVTLYVKSNCNWYKLKKTIRVSDKVKEANSPMVPPSKPKTKPKKV